MNFTVSQAQALASALAGALSSLGVGLAEGKYEPEVVLTVDVLKAIGAAWPPALMIEQGIELALWINSTTLPRTAMVKDGRGGYVPFRNSRVMPDGLLRDYDPTIDGPAP